MKTFAITTEPYGTFAAADGVVYAEKDNADRHGERLRALVDQANAAGELWRALDAIAECPDYRNIGTHEMRIAREIIAKYRGIA